MKPFIAQSINSIHVSDGWSILALRSPQMIFELASEVSLLYSRFDTACQQVLNTKEEHSDNFYFCLLDYAAVCAELRTCLILNRKHQAPADEGSIYKTPLETFSWWWRHFKMETCKLLYDLSRKHKAETAWTGKLKFCQFVVSEELRIASKEVLKLEVDDKEDPRISIMIQLYAYIKDAVDFVSKQFMTHKMFPIVTSSWPLMEMIPFFVVMKIWGKAFLEDGRTPQ